MPVFIPAYIKKSNFSFLQYRAAPYRILSFRFKKKVVLGTISTFVDFRRLKSTKVASKSSRVEFTKSTKVNELRDIFKAVKNYKFKKILSSYQLFIIKIKSFFIFGNKYFFNLYFSTD